METPKNQPLSNNTSESFTTQRETFRQKAHELAVLYGVKESTVVRLFADSTDSTFDSFKYEEDNLPDVFNNPVVDAVRWREVEQILLAGTDKLTGLANRRLYDQRLSEKAHQLRRERKTDPDATFSLVAFDIDKFKDINDNFGHSTGDEILKEVARIIKIHTRDSDFAARYGGEEIFIIVDGDLTAAELIANRIRHDIEMTDVRQFGIDPGIRKNITISAGIAEYEKGGVVDILEETKRLSERADDALYQAKDNGRNQIVISQ